MATEIKQILQNSYNIQITALHAKQVKSLIRMYEVRLTHPDTLNTPMLGITKMYFLPKDTLALFDIFNIEKTKFTKTVHQAKEIDTSRVVTSDPYNLLTTWLVYLIGKSKLSSKLKHEVQTDLLKLLHYKFFTGIVNHSFPYQANEDVMRYTIDNLSAKFDIKHRNTNTWRLLMAARVEDVLSRSSIHVKTIATYSDDAKILYLISDMQTRMRARLSGIICQFYQNMEEGNRIGTYEIVNEIDGDKVIKGITATFDIIVDTVSRDALNVNKFIDNNNIDIVVKLTKNIRVDMLRAFLIKFSDIAVTQHTKNQDELTKGNEKFLKLIGYRVLISHIIQKTYRAAILDKVDMKSKIAILDKTRNIYRSSRITDNDIHVIKNSVEALVHKYSDSKRSSTNASLKIAFITYIIIHSFKAM